MNRPMPPWFRPMVVRLIAQAKADADRDGYQPPLLVEEVAR